MKIKIWSLSHITNSMKNNPQPFTQICANAAKLNASWAGVEKACSVDVDVAKEEATQLGQKKTCQKGLNLNTKISIQI